VPPKERYLKKLLFGHPPKTNGRYRAEYKNIEVAGVIGRENLNGVGLYVFDSLNIQPYPAEPENSFRPPLHAEKCDSAAGIVNNGRN